MSAYWRRGCALATPSWHIRRVADPRDYRPELERLKADKEKKAEEAKAAHLERMMRDMGVDGAKIKSSNPFGPHARNDREDAYLDHRGGDDSEDEEIEEQMEMEEEADDAPELGKADVPPVEYGGRDSEVNFPAPR